MSRRSSGLESGDAASSSKRVNANVACWLELISRLSLLSGAIPVLARASRNRAWRREMNRGGRQHSDTGMPHAARRPPLSLAMLLRSKWQNRLHPLGMRQSTAHRPVAAHLQLFRLAQWTSHRRNSHVRNDRVVECRG
jgi:hypothetical protein